MESRFDPLLRRGVPRFVQDNPARSSGSVMRGLHYQLKPAASASWWLPVRRIFDVAVCQLCRNLFECIRQAEWQFIFTPATA
jgi:dTDP-4-dehydrorhamnose 3,5-epimerase-like enzyme